MLMVVVVEEEVLSRKRWSRWRCEGLMVVVGWWWFWWL